MINKVSGSSGFINEYELELNEQAIRNKQRENFYTSTMVSADHLQRRVKIGQTIGKELRSQRDEEIELHVKSSKLSKVNTVMAYGLTGSAIAGTLLALFLGPGAPLAIAAIASSSVLGIGKGVTGYLNGLETEKLNELTQKMLLLKTQKELNHSRTTDTMEDFTKGQERQLNSWKQDRESKNNQHETAVSIIKG